MSRARACARRLTRPAQDREPALSALSVTGLRAPLGALVLQEGAGLFQVRAAPRVRGFSTHARRSHRKKREAKIKRDVKRGVREANEQDPFEIFVTVTDIRYTCVASTAPRRPLR